MMIGMCPWLSFVVVPFLAIETYGMGHVDVESLYRGRGPTLDDIGHLLRPPGYVLECCRWMNAAVR